MQEQLLQIIRRVASKKKILLAALLGSAMIPASLLLTIHAPSQDPLATVGTAQINIHEPEFAIATVGATSTALEAATIESSWPGEIISLENVPVQPTREGTIVSWNVHIGERVSAGEALGTLSPPPSMPDTIAMLAEEEKMAKMARVNVEAKRAYTKERVAQLEALRANIEGSLRASQKILGTDTSEANVSGSANFSMIDAKKATLRALLRGSLAKTHLMLSGQSTLPARWTAITLKDAIGEQNSRLRNQYPTALFAALADLEVPDRLPLASGLAYFDLVIKLADASIPDGAMLSDMELIELKAMLHEDQEEFLMAADALRETELEALDTEKMSFEQLRMIDGDIAMLKQDLAMAEGDALAKEGSYRAIFDATAGRTTIVAPRAGIVSSILKKPGEFVEPGMPVAVVTGGGKNALLVRMRIPSNVQKPEIGAMLSVVRTGFVQNVHSAKLVGIGNALDETGSLVADAVLLESADWPVGASVRVISSAETRTFSIPLSSIWWNAKGVPNVWAVSEGGRVYAQPIILGRTVGAAIEVYSGLLTGDRYIIKPTPKITEDMLLTDLTMSDIGDRSSKKPAIDNPHVGHAGMEGME